MSRKEDRELREALAELAEEIELLAQEVRDHIKHHDTEAKDVVLPNNSSTPDLAVLLGGDR